MGIAVVGGMIFATFLTLFVVPAIYTYISSETKISSDENKNTVA
jgi:multidrug efflux pump